MSAPAAPAQLQHRKEHEPFWQNVALRVEYGGDSYPVDVAGRHTHRAALAAHYAWYAAACRTAPSALAAQVPA